jgi:hypothetical protein
MTPVEWPSPYGYSLFCDDLRREEGGKITLVGLYGSEMIILGSVPTQLPKLALVVTYSERPGESDKPLELVIYFPGDSDDAPGHRVSLATDQVEEFRRKRVSELELDDPRLTMRLDAVFSPMPIKQEGYIKVRMIRGDAEIRLGALRIRTQPPAAEQAS